MTMNATSLYVSTCRLILQANTEDPNSWTDLYRLVPYLRQSLSCTVCSNLLIEPHTPLENNCQHHVCRTCKGGRKKLKPACAWCRDYEKYIENVQLRILLQCYKKLCDYLTSTAIYRCLLLNAVSSSKGVQNTAASISLADLIQEGAGFKDEFISNSGLSKSAYSILPCVYTSSTSTQTNNTNQSSDKLVNSNSNEIPSAPPIKTVSNGGSIYSVMYAGSGNKITIKRKSAIPEPFESNTLPQETYNLQQQQPFENSNNLSELYSNKKASKSRKSPNNFKKPRSSSSRNKKKGCRCGNATAVPGKLTCCGQRCPCYVESKPCIECRCRGCRNPHTADGYKIRPHIPELQNLQLQFQNTLNSENVPNDPMSTVQQCFTRTPSIQVLNVYSTPNLNIANMSSVAKEEAVMSSESESEASDVHIDV